MIYIYQKAVDFFRYIPDSSFFSHLGGLGYHGAYFVPSAYPLSLHFATGLVRSQVERSDSSLHAP
jgi:hypothetical protein